MLYIDISNLLIKTLSYMSIDVKFQAKGSALYVISDKGLKTWLLK